MGIFFYLSKIEILYIYIGYFSLVPPRLTFSEAEVFSKFISLAVLFQYYDFVLRNEKSKKKKKSKNKSTPTKQQQQQQQQKTSFRQGKDLMNFVITIKKIIEYFIILILVK